MPAVQNGDQGRVVLTIMAVMAVMVVIAVMAVMTLKVPITANNDNVSSSGLRLAARLSDMAVMALIM